MAVLDYKTAVTGIFVQIGKSIKVLNEYGVLAGTTIPGDEDEVIDVIEAGDAENRRDIAAALRTHFANLKSFADSSFRSPLAEVVTQRLQDQDTVVSLLNLETTSIQRILYAMIQDMNTATVETVDQSVVTISAVTAHANNIGDGTTLTDKVLDGVSSPGRGMAPHPDYKDLDSELCAGSAANPDTITVTCTRDSQRDGAFEGSETFVINGDFSRGPFSALTPNGSGGPTTIQPVSASAIISNGTFEFWGSGSTANIPTGWDLDLGTAGTHVVEESSAANVYRGDKAIKLLGDAAETDIKISQGGLGTNNFTALIQPNRRYFVCARVKGTAGMSAGQLNIEFAGTGYTVGSDKIEMDSTALAAQTSYGLESFFFNAPSSFPDDFELKIHLSGTPTAHAVYIDDLFFAPVTWHGGFCIVVVPGATKFQNGDRFTFTVENDRAGTFQEFFRRYYGIQLPSAAGAGETILDALAE